MKGREQTRGLGPGPCIGEGVENLLKKTLKNDRGRSVVDAKGREVFQGRGDGQLILASQSSK